MFYRINFEKLTLRKTASPTAEGDEKLVDLLDRIVKLEETVGDDGKPWWQVDVFTPNEPPRRGFIAGSHLDEIPDSELRWPPEINRVQFIAALTTAARKYGTNRDYLALVAQMESGIRNDSSSGNTEATGPFRFTPSSWKELVELDAQSDAPSNVRIDDIDAPWSQALMAALLTAENADALSKALARVPTGLELYVAHLFGLDAAETVLAARDNDSAQNIDAPLKESLGDAEAAKLMQVQESLLMSSGAPRTVAQVIDALEKGMLDASEKVAPDIAQLPEDLRIPRHVPSGEPPWLTVARAEFDKGVREDPVGSNPEIEKYFETTTFGRTTDDTAWCGAFVSFCLSSSNDQVVSDSNLKSARAADWIKWGEAITDPPVGAMCILNPLVEGASGHVAFFMRNDGNKVVLLGGNQGDAVSEQAFKATNVRTYRWLDWPGSGATGDDATGSVGSVGSVAPGSRVKLAYDHLRGEFTPEQAAGLVGNFMQESGETLDPNALNRHERAIGIAQWQRDRRDNLKTFAAQKGTTETDFNLQLQFVTHELNGSEGRATTKIKESTTTKDAAIAVRQFYERAQPAHDGNRIAFAQRVADKFGTT